MGNRCKYAEMIGFNLLITKYQNIIRYSFLSSCVKYFNTSTNYKALCIINNLFKILKLGFESNQHGTFANSCIFYCNYLHTDIFFS